MRFVDIQETEFGSALDPTPYLEWLEQSGDELPEGAAAFARDPGHYKFGDRCMKSLYLDSVVLEPGDGGIGARVVFRGPGEEGTPRLVIHYEGVTEFSVLLDSEAEIGALYRGLRYVLLDEILPAGSQCSHEIRFVLGTIRIACLDLDAEWCAA
ncbi:hypothetical protein AB0B28_10595 [Glycomyces sp. NPDC046736]|uniref:hypothetical protein n=1 Tax=Glycomyces sp. NPDC046736 TaxID=3155615 RepID=UPI0033FB0CF3